MDPYDFADLCLQRICDRCLYGSVRCNFINNGCHCNDYQKLNDFISFFRDSFSKVDDVQGNLFEDLNLFTEGTE